MNPMLIRSLGGGLCERPTELAGIMNGSVEAVPIHFKKFRRVKILDLIGYLNVVPVVNIRQIIHDCHRGEDTNKWRAETMTKDVPKTLTVGYQIRTKRAT